MKRLLEREDEDCMKLVVHYGLEGTRRMLRQLFTGHAMLDADRFLARDARQFASEWVALPQHGLSSAARARLWPRPNCGRGSSFASARERIVERCHARAPGALARSAGGPRARRTLRARAARFVALEEIREAAQVRGAGNKKTWPSEEIYEAVKTGFERLRKEIDEFKQFTQLDTAAIERSCRTDRRRGQGGARRRPPTWPPPSTRRACSASTTCLVRTRNVLRQSESVRRETAASIAALLVDEFQDTDPVQAEIVEALVGDGLADGKLFVVGDAKQSIYRFRRADPAVFDAMRARIPVARDACR